MVLSFDKSKRASRYARLSPVEASKSQFRDGESKEDRIGACKQKGPRIRQGRCSSESRRRPFGPGNACFVHCGRGLDRARRAREAYVYRSAKAIERNDRRILFTGDTAFCGLRELRKYGSIDLGIFSIAAYNPWIQSHCTPEEAVRMANDAAARFIMPVHHQTFRLSFEPFREPIERFETALKQQPDRIALREIGETFVLPSNGDREQQ